MAYTAYRVLRAPIDQVEAFMAKAIAEGWQPLGGPFTQYPDDRIIHQAIVKGTASAGGSDGADGREVELQAGTTHVQWRYVGESTWNDLIPLADLKGADGDPGADGREVELQSGATHIQWRYIGDSTWSNLVALADLKGAKGDPGEKGDPGADGSDGAPGPDNVLAGANVPEIPATGEYTLHSVDGELSWVEVVA